MGKGDKHQDRRTVDSLVRQCPTCPWRLDADLAAIPGYDPDLHARLDRTIAEPCSLRGSGVGMACHYAEPGRERDLPCAGWLAHQLGPGNNIPLRLAVLSGRLPRPEVDGPQHESFEATRRLG